jgi:hypothetical protein
MSHRNVDLARRGPIRDGRRPLERDVLEHCHSHDLRPQLVAGSWSLERRVVRLRAD